MSGLGKDGQAAVGDSLGQEGSVEARFREAMAGLLKRLQAYESDPALDQLYHKYGMANGVPSRPAESPAVRPIPRGDSGEAAPPSPLPRPEALPKGDSGEVPALPPLDSGEPAALPALPRLETAGVDSGETALSPLPRLDSVPSLPRLDSGETAGADAGETGLAPLPRLESGEPALPSLPRLDSGETAGAASGEPALPPLPRLDSGESAPPGRPGPELEEPSEDSVPESGEFPAQRATARSASVELPGGYTGQASILASTPAMPPAQPAGAAFAPPSSSFAAVKPSQAERKLSPEEAEARAKRRVARIKCDYLASCVCGEETLEVRISDLAIEGAGITASGSLERGQVVTLNQPGNVPGNLGQAVQGRVMWCQPTGGRTEAGLMFIDSPEAMSTSWVVELLDQLTENQNQNLFEDRTLAEKKDTLTVRAESADGVKAVGRLLNLGLGSAKASLDQEYKKNSKVDVILGPYQELEALLLPGQVLSVRDDDEDDRWVHEIRFLDKSSHQTGVLGRYVLALLQEADL
ncbi:hypothetical protein DYH09_01145 [bacterium CPR1]|nr:hypothetical protein [bacterium CPR1]